MVSSWYTKLSGLLSLWFSSISNFAQRIFNKPRLGKVSLQQWEHLLFLTGLTTWIILQGTMVTLFLWSRAEPPEIDDTYGYTVQGAFVQECFWHDCLAAQDLYDQLDTPSADPNIEWQRTRAYNRTLLFYTPLYSIFLAALNSLGLDWDLLVRLIWNVWVPISGIFFGRWLRVLWGPAPAGIAMGLLALQIFPGHGYHFVVPSTITMSLAVVIWTNLVLRHGMAPWSLVIGTFILVLIHPIGLIYAAISIGLALVLTGWPVPWRVWLPVLLAMGMVGLYMLLPSFIDRPTMEIQSYPLTPGQTLVDAFLEGIEDALRAVFGWARDLLSLGLSVAIILAGYMTVTGDKKKPVFWTTVLLGGAAIVSLLIIRPRFPASVFLRLWVPLGVLLTGLVGNLIWFMIQRAGHYLRNKQKTIATATKDSDSMQHRLLSPAREILLIVLLLCGFTLDVGYSGVNRLYHGYVAIRDIHSIDLDPDQVEVLLSLAESGDRVFYTNEIQRDFYLTHGALKYGAIFYPVLKDTAEAQYWFQRSDIRFAVFPDPVEWLTFKDNWYYGLVHRNGTLAAEHLYGLNVVFPRPLAPARIFIWVENTGGANQVALYALNDEGHPQVDTPQVTATIPAQWTGWIEMNPTANAAASAAWGIRFSDVPGYLGIGGLRINDTTLQWPWEQLAQMTLLPRNPNVPPLETISFDLAQLLPEPLAKDRLEVLHDGGATVLVSLDQSDPPTSDPDH
jgi:hypothetical protein